RRPSRSVLALRPHQPSPPHHHFTSVPLRGPNISSPAPPTRTSRTYRKICLPLYSTLTGTTITPTITIYPPTTSRHSNTSNNSSTEIPRQTTAPPPPCHSYQRHRRRRHPPPRRLLQRERKSSDPRNARGLRRRLIFR